MHLFLGHLCHSLQREIPSHRRPGRLERNPTRTWGGEDHQTTWDVRQQIHAFFLRSGSPLHCHPRGQSSQGPQTRQHRWGVEISNLEVSWNTERSKNWSIGVCCYTGWRLWGVFNHLLMDHHHPPRGAPQACNHLACGPWTSFCYFAKLTFFRSTILVTLSCGEMTKRYQDSARSSTSKLKFPWSKYKIRSHVHWRLLQKFSTILLSCGLPPVLLRVVNYLLITSSKYAFTF